MLQGGEVLQGRKVLLGGEVLDLSKNVEPPAIRHFRRWSSYVAPSGLEYTGKHDY
jgi:hypothetical protein